MGRPFPEKELKTKHSVTPHLKLVSKAQKNMTSKPKINLPSALVIGHAEMDEDHSRLFDILMDPEEAGLGKHATFQERGKVFCAEMERHMESEEALMESTDYPKTEAHKIHHRNALKLLREFVDSNKEDLIQECMHEFVSHIIKNDFDFFLFLERKKSHTLTL